ncbi:MAG TPA: glycosyltransferase family 2 protein [Solirubrobacteraceae bacterium]|nr:glycosyltransferase family 2 protein [Solirubrobacteraceae bacterium]
MNLPPTVDVVIVSYETRSLLRECLRSLQEHAPLGLRQTVVVDNSSKDGSATMVESAFPAALLIANSVNVGFGAAANIGARACSAKWLAIGNADVAVTSGALDALIAAGEASPSAAVLAPSLLLPSGDIQLSTWRFPSVLHSASAALGIHHLLPSLSPSIPPGEDMRRAASAQVDWAMGAFLLFRRDAFDQIGGFDETHWMYGEDLDICWRLRQAGWQTRYVGDAQVHHVGGAAAEASLGETVTAMKLAAHYASLVRRQGVAAARLDELFRLAGIYLRLGVLLATWRFRRNGAPWSARLKMLRQWRDATLLARRRDRDWRGEGSTDPPTIRDA